MRTVLQHHRSAQLTPFSVLATPAPYHFLVYNPGHGDEALNPSTMLLQAAADSVGVTFSAGTIYTLGHLSSPLLNSSSQRRDKESEGCLSG